MTSPRIALVTCAELPELDPDNASAAEALRKHAEVSTPVWDDPTVDWSSYDLVIVRSTWDYVPRRDEFVAWAKSVPNLINPAELIEWNTDKIYLRELAEAGVPTIPTIWLEATRPWETRAIHTRFPAMGEFVIKPTVSAGAQRTGRYVSVDAPARGQAVVLAKELLELGSSVMIQPYLKRIDEFGESALVFINGEFSHAIRKGALLTGPYQVDADPTSERDITPRGASPDELAVAEKAFESLRQRFPELKEPLLYARVDLVPDNDGNPVLIELELTEPSLFLRSEPWAADRFARAVLKHLR